MPRPPLPAIALAGAALAGCAAQPPAPLPASAAVPVGMLTAPAGAADLPPGPCTAPRAICEAARHVRERVRWESDRDAWGVEQHWATPAQAYARGVGDCEDLALLVRLELVSRGVPSSRIDLHYGYLDGDVFHVWLTVRDGQGRRWTVSNARVAAAPARAT